MSVRVILDTYFHPYVYYGHPGWGTILKNDADD